MPDITASFDGQTVITTFEMTPGTAADLMEALQAAYAEFIRHQPGFLGAGPAHERRTDPDRQLLAMAATRGFHGDAPHPRNARAEPGDRGPLRAVRAGDV